MAFAITSPKFSNRAEIPADFTAEGRDVSPPLHWTELPEGTKSLALIVDDPDAPDPAAPKRTFVHWVVYNLSPEQRDIPEAASGGLPSGAEEGLNDWNKRGYGGPNPPTGKHRYFFKLFALDAPLPHLDEPTKQSVLDAMQGHVLAQTELVGTYEKRS
jgi:Raf kinase inhibitor-like YbhB/YbcL family protein